MDDPDYRKSKIVTVRLTPDEIRVLMANRQGSPGKQTITALVRTAIRDAYMKATVSQSNPIPDSAIHMDTEHTRVFDPSTFQGLVRDVLSLENGACVLQYPKRMSKHELADLLEWLTLLQRKLRRLEDENTTDNE
jgi:hypothetical protein